MPTGPKPPRLSSTPPANPLTGIAMMVASGAFLTTNDALMKYLATDLPVGQIVFLRGFPVMAALVIIAWRADGWAELRVNSWRVQLLSAGLFTASLFIFVSSLPLMPLVDAIVLIYTSPMLVMALAPLLLKERVGWRRWLAASVGFAGAALLTRPSGAADWVYLLPLGVSLLLALRDVLMRHIAGTETATSLVFVGNVMTMVLALPTLLFGWAPLTPLHYLLMALSGVFFAIAQVLMVECFRHAEAAVVVPFRYTSVLWAVVLGWLVWNQHPDVWGFLGIALVVVGGFVVARREARARAENKGGEGA